LDVVALAFVRRVAKKVKEGIPKVAKKVSR
jgi:hypothetical protein